MDIIIRNIGKEYIAKVDEIAKRQGKSRNTFLKDYFELMAEFPAILVREDRLEKFLEECEQQLLANAMLLDMYTDFFRELSGLDEEEET